MKCIKNIFLVLICGGYFFLSVGISHGFLGEDLGLDIYKNIDEGIYDLELKQYEYEMTGQGETDVSEVVGTILSKEGLNCEIETIQDIEDIISGPNPIGVVQLKCNNGNEELSSQLVSRVSQKLSDIKQTFADRAENKSQKIYEIAKIGLYSDGNQENSPFDLMVDLQEIDRVIFSEEIEYQGEELSVGDEELFDFLNEDKGYIYEEEEEETPGEEDVPENGEENPGEEDVPENGEENPGEEDIPEHEYACFPEDLSGLDPGELEDLDEGVYTGNDDLPRPPIPVIEDDFDVITDGEYSNGASWGGPFRGSGPNAPYAGVSDAWNCDTFFCIVIEFVVKDQKLLGGGQTTSIESILAKAGEHLEKFANTSLVQSKMTTNNFELGLIIPNLGDMLRGFGIQIQTKPAPILNVEASEEKKEKVEGDLFTGKNLLTKYYKGIGLDYERRNDLDIINQKTYEKQVVGESTGLTTAYAPARLAELEKFTDSLEERNSTVQLAVDKKILQDDSSSFYDQFVELERFVGSIRDFTESLSGIIQKMQSIPTRKS